MKISQNDEKLLFKGNGPTKIFIYICSPLLINCNKGCEEIICSSFLLT